MSGRLVEGCGVNSLFISFSTSEGKDAFEDIDDWLPSFSMREGREGDPIGVWMGELLCESAAIAAIAWLWSGGEEGLIASAFVTSVLTIGDEALAKEPDRSALGFSEPDDRISMLVDEPLKFGLVRFRADLADLRE